MDAESDITAANFLCFLHKAIGELKFGKFDDDSLISNHIIEAPILIYQFLAHLFTFISA